MEEIEELRAKAIASMVSSVTQKISPKSKEEGELSDDEEMPACSSAVNVTVTPPPVSNVALMTKSNQSSKTGKVASSNDPASSADIPLKTSVKKNYSKPFVRNSAPSIHGNPYASAWYAPSVPNNNLVISFSDDESGSDSQERRPDETPERKEIGFGAERSSEQVEPEFTQKNAYNQMIKKPRIVALSRTFVSSLTKIHGANSRGSGPSLAEQVPHIRNSDPFNNAPASQENEVSPHMNSNRSKLEDLRQQIALKENQLKLKSVQQNKSTNSGSYHDHNGTNLSNNAVKKSRPASGNTTRLVSYEPERKRLKLERYQRKSNPDDQQQIYGSATKSESKSRILQSENIRQKDGNPIADKSQAKVGNQICVLSGNLVPRVKDDQSSRSFRETTSSKVPNCKLRNKHGDNSDISSRCFLSGKSNKLIDLSASLNQSSPSVQMTSREDNGGACQFKMSSPKNSNTDGSKVSGTFGVPRSSAVDNEARHNVVQSSEYNEIVLSDRIQAPLTDSIFDKSSALIPESKFGNSNASPSNLSLRDWSGQMNLLGHNHVNEHTLVQMEESHDKELEEAQEHRHRCELEERNALKAYREAQRALFEANAKCTYLYRKRELFSTQFRAFMTEDPSSLWSSKWHKHPKDGTDSLNNAHEADLDNFTTSDHQRYTEFEVTNHDSSIQPTYGAMVHTSCQQIREHNLVAEACNESDAKDDDAVNGVCTPSHHTSMSADEDEEASPFGHRTTQSTIMHEDVENLEKGVPDLNNNSERVSSVDNENDYALLEASLRSELFARLGTKNISKNKNLREGEGHTANDGIDSEIKNSDTTMSNKTCAELGEVLRGTDGPGRSICWPSIQVHTPTQGLGDKCSDDESHRIGDNEESSHSLAKACRSAASIFSSPSPVLKLACSYMKVTPLISSGGIQTKTREKRMNDISHEKESGLAHSELLLGVVKAHLRGNIGEVGCYSCKGLIDPFWPVCMFELRGRCNDEECLLQHVKDYSGGNVNQHDYPERADREVALSSHVEKVSGACNLSRSHQQFIISAPPTYLVGLDLLKADLPTSGSVLAQSVGRCWQKGFSTSSAVPFTIQKTHFPSGASFCGSDDCLGSQGSRSRQSMYFQRQDDSLIGHGMDDPEQCLDMALVLFDGDLNKLEGMKKARTVLSRALESNPTYVALWIVYLHIHYRNEKTIGKDDMFSHAIHYNEGSYELWLMYINSRVQLDDRLVAYDTAISALCRHASSPDRDRVHASACILDLFVQLLDCLCMSEDIGRAIQRIYGLLPTATNVANNGSILLSDILACLTVSDRCIFWICCVYVVIYRKLPDAVVHQFESEKELRFVVEWPSVELTASEKHRALELMKMGVDSVGLNGGMCEREVHFLSASYVQCVAVLEGIECSKNLLEKYFKLYPTCLELILTSARLHRDYFGDSSFEVFEDALCNWPREIPGVQCIWNQYAQCALESGGFDIAKQLMVRWFESVCEVDCPQSGKLDVMEDDGLYHSPESLSPRPDVCFTFSNPKDELFGLLNLSLHRLLQSDHVKARFAIDRALKVVGPEDFEHCVREHAVFVSSDILGPMEGAPCSGIMGLLNIYLKDIRVLPGSEPLSRMFCRDIRKPRIRQLINKILCPVPCNYSLVNSILDSCYGPTLLPENYGDVKDLVDLIETLMELYPANYPLALAVCKLITRKFTSSGIASSSILFWACSVLVNSIYQAFPVAPELKWVEVSGILSNLVEAQGISERFHQHALSIYPCSVELWKSYYKFSKQKGNESLVVQTARERGIKLE